MTYQPTTPPNKSKPQLLLYVLLPMTFAAALFLLSGPAESFAQAEPPTPVTISDTTLNTDVVVVGDRVRLAITVKNLGPNDEPKLLSLVNTLPDGISFASFSGQDWDCKHDTDTRTTNCEHNAPLPAGHTTDLLLLAHRDSDPRQSYVNSTTALGTLSDPNLDNNSVETELFYLTTTKDSPNDTSADASSHSEQAPATNESAEADHSATNDSTDTGRQIDDSAAAEDNKPVPVLPKTGTNLTALLVVIGTAMAFAGRTMVGRSEQSKMLAYALNLHSTFTKMPSTRSPRNKRR